MSQLNGIIGCPQCGGTSHRLEDWDTYISVICAACGHKAGELASIGEFRQLTQEFRRSVQEFMNRNDDLLRHLADDDSEPQADAAQLRAGFSGNIIVEPGQ